MFRTCSKKVWRIKNEVFSKKFWGLLGYVLASSLVSKSRSKIQKSWQNIFLWFFWPLLRPRGWCQNIPQTSPKLFGKTSFSTPRTFLEHVRNMSKKCILNYHNMSYNIIWNNIITYDIITYDIISYDIISYYIIAYGII